MEKYSRWSDHQSGVHPFTPAVGKGKRTAKAWYKCLPEQVGGLLLSLLRIPFVLLSLALLFGLSALVRPVSRALLRLVELVLCRLVLFLLGYHSLPSRQRLPQAAGSLVLLGHHTSYIDLIYLAYRISPAYYAFAVNVWPLPASDAAVNTTARRLIDNDELTTEIRGRTVAYSSLFSAIKSIWSNAERTLEQSEPTVDVLRRAKGPVVAVPEGTTSNGQLLLYCVHMFDGAMGSIPRDYALASVTYPKSHRPIFTGEQRWFWHLCQVAMNPSNSITLCVPELDASLPQVPEEEEQARQWQNQVFDQVALLRRVPRAKVGAALKPSFLAYFAQTSRSFFA